MTTAHEISGMASPLDFSEADPGLVLPLMESVERMPAPATGAFLFGPAQKPFGTVLVENGRVCWAGAAKLGSRLSDLLRSKLSPGADPHALEETVRRCLRTSTPLGEALVESGLMSAELFREALHKHTSEALLVLMHDERAALTWHAHRKQRYDARFTFSPTEIMSGIGACITPDKAAEARKELERYLKAEGCGLAFFDDTSHGERGETESGSKNFFLVSDKRGAGLTITEMQQLGAWGRNAFLRSPFEPGSEPRLFTLRGADGDSLITWRTHDLLYVVICPSSSSFAFIVGKRTRTSPDDRSGSS